MSRGKSALVYITRIVETVVCIAIMVSMIVKTALEFRFFEYLSQFFVNMFILCGALGCASGCWHISFMVPCTSRYFGFLFTYWLRGVFYIIMALLIGFTNWKKWGILYSLCSLLSIFVAVLLFLSQCACWHDFCLVSYY